MFICCSAEVPGRAVLSPMSCLCLSDDISPLIVAVDALLHGMLSDAALERLFLLCVTLFGFKSISVRPTMWAYHTEAISATME